MASFNINDGGGSDNLSSGTLAYYGGWSTVWAISSRSAAATVNAAERGQDGTLNNLLVTDIQFRVGSNSSTLTRGKAVIWTNGGSYIAKGTTTDIGQDTANPMSLRTFPFGSTLLTGGTTYRWGVLINNSGRLNYAWEDESGEEVEVQRPTADNTSWSTDYTVQTSRTLIGTITYVTMPRSVTLGSSSATSSSVSFTITPDTVSTTSATTDYGYLIQYKRTSESDASYVTWTGASADAVENIGTRAARTITVSGLTAGTSYTFRVGAKNTVTRQISSTETSPWVTLAVSTLGGPHVYSGGNWDTRALVSVYNGTDWVTSPLGTVKVYDSTYIDGSGSRWRTIT
jgi:hypothetical protein